MLTKERKDFLTQRAKEARTKTLNMIYHIGRGHVGGCMSITELLVVLYYEIMNVDPANPKWAERDRLVISKGHAAPILYALLAMKGFIPTEELQSLNQNGTNLPSHCDRKRVPGIDMTAGSLGQGLSAAVGMAIANKLDGRDTYVYSIIGDGESQEGQIWEAVMFSAQRKLDNLIVFVDDNGCQVDGFTADINNMRPFDKKFEAFGWDAQYVDDGHSFDKILDAIAKAKAVSGKPHCIVLNTIKAKAVIGAENTYQSHCFGLTEAQLQQSLANL